MLLFLCALGPFDGCIVKLGEKARAGAEAMQAGPV